MVNNDCLQDLRVLYTFAPNKPFGSLLDISPSKYKFSETFNSEYKLKYGSEIKKVNH